MELVRFGEMFNKLRNVFATLVVTFLLKGGLSKMMLRLCFGFWLFCSSLWNFNFVLWYPLFFFKAVSYSDFVLLKNFSLDEFLFNFLLIDHGKCLMTWGGWLQDVLRYNKESLGFLHGHCVPFVGLKVTSKKTKISRFVWI